MSAADGFFSAFKELPQTVHIGVASGGSSGAYRPIILPASEIIITLSSNASFRPEGLTFDGYGVEVDIEVWPRPQDYVTERDAVLETAIDFLQHTVNSDQR